MTIWSAMKDMGTTTQAPCRRTSDLGSLRDGRVFVNPTPYGRSLLELHLPQGIISGLPYPANCTCCQEVRELPEVDDAFSLVLGADDANHGENGASSERPGFEVSITPHPTTDEGKPFKVGIDKQVRAKGVAGPWIRQTVTIHVRGWSPECKEPEYKCDAEIEEAIRVLGANGQPIPNTPTKDPTIGSTSPQGGSIGKSGKAAAKNRQPGKQLGAAKGDHIDHHRFIVDLQKLAAKNCGICRLHIKVSVKIIDQCYAASPPDLGGKPVFTEDPSAHVDYVLIKYTQDGNCLCAKDSHDASEELGSLFTCQGKTSEYHYEYLWDICPCKKDGLPPPPSSGTPPTITPPPSITPSPPLPPVVTPPGEPKRGAQITPPSGPIQPRAPFGAPVPTTLASTATESPPVAVGPRGSVPPGIRGLVVLLLMALLGNMVSGCAARNLTGSTDTRAEICRTYDVGCLAYPVSEEARLLNEVAVERARERSESPFGLGYTYILPPLAGVDNVVAALRYAMTEGRPTRGTVCAIDERHIRVCGDESLQRDVRIKLRELIETRHEYETGTVAREVDSI